MPSFPHTISRVSIIARMSSLEEVPQGPSTFPLNPEEFDADHRISFSRLNSKFILEQNDGSEYEFDDALKRWIPVLDEELLEQQRKAYVVAGVDESEDVQETIKKRKRVDKEYVNGQDVSFFLIQPQILWLMIV